MPRLRRQPLNTALVAASIAISLAAGVAHAAPRQAQPPTEGAQACPQLVGWRLVPESVIADALANPAHYGGWMQPNNPSLPTGPYNPPRVYLSIMAPGKPFHPLFNTVIWKAGCL
jgi:hypothetical protein